MPKQQQGFTMIELVMVIVILGILAAVALPRFYDMQSNARVAKARAIYGAIRSAATIVHSAALVNNLTPSNLPTTGNTVNLEGAHITLYYNYPTVASIANAANLNDSNDNITTVVGVDGATATTIQVKGATTPASCQVSYTSPSASGNSPVISVDVSGC